jgi:hypothetical protein
MHNSILGLEMLSLDRRECVLDGNLIVRLRIQMVFSLR